jgi:hypothetical protein
MFAVHPRAGSRLPGGYFSYWQPVGDAIAVGTPLPLAGVMLRLRPDGRDLRGTVTAFTDALEAGKPSEVSKPVRARRVACTTTPP